MHLKILSLITFFLVQFANGAVLLNKNIYERDNRVDFMLSFDAPFQGTIKKIPDKNGIVTMRLSGVKTDRPFFKNLDSPFVESITVTKSNNDSILVKIVPRKGKVGIKASKTVDGFGLRFRIYPLTTVHPGRNGLLMGHTNQKNPPLNSLLKKDDTVPGSRYWLVMGFLVALLAIMWLLKRYTAKKGLNNWLMPKSATPEELLSEASVRFQKSIDGHNKVVLLEYNNKQYLLLVGNNNVLLDRFGYEKIDEEDEFTRLFERNRQKLNQYLEDKLPDAYEVFKENASKDNF